MASYNPVTHVIFDVDGTIFDTESYQEIIFKEIAEKFGKEFTPELRQKLLGRTEKDAISIFITELGIPLCAEECIKLKKKIIKEANPKPSFMPGVERLVYHLKKFNIPIAMATSSKHDSLARKFKFHQSFCECFDHITSSSDPDVKNPKPAPDIYIVCASQFSDKPDPKNCLAIEDSPSGVQSAVSAGMQVLMVPYPNLNPELTKEATLVIKSLCDFKPEIFGLPPFTD